MEWNETLLPQVGKRVCRLGLATNYGVTPADLEYAAERGINVWVWSPTQRGGGAVSPVLKSILAKDRDRHVVLVLGGGYFPWMVNWGLEKARRDLGIDKVDAFLLGWLGVTSALTDSNVEALRTARAEGKATAVGTSIHDRQIGRAHV